MKLVLEDDVFSVYTNGKCDEEEKLCNVAFETVSDISLVRTVLYYACVRACVVDFAVEIEIVVCVCVCVCVWKDRCFSTAALTWLTVCLEKCCSKTRHSCCMSGHIYHDILSRLPWLLVCFTQCQLDPHSL